MYTRVNKHFNNTSSRLQCPDCAASSDRHRKPLAALGADVADRVSTVKRVNNHTPNCVKFCLAGFKMHHRSGTASDEPYD